MPPIRLDEGSEDLLLRYDWPGNIRQLRNLVERLSVIAEERTITEEILKANLPANAGVRHPALLQPNSFTGDFVHEEQVGQISGGVSSAAIYALLREVKGNVSELTQLLYRILQGQNSQTVTSNALPQTFITPQELNPSQSAPSGAAAEGEFVEIIEGEKVLTLEEMEQKYIELVLKRNNGSRKKTAEELNISERTLYRKLNKE